MVARAIRAVEREVAGCQFLERLAIAGPGQVLAEHDRVRLDRLPVLVELLTPNWQHLDLGDALRQRQGRLHRLGQATLDAIPQHQSVDHDLNGVLLVSGKVDLVGELVEFAVHDRPAEALGGQVGQQGVVGPLAAPDHGCQHLEAGALPELEDPIHDLLRGLANQALTGLRIVWHADPCIQQAEVVVDLGDCAHGRAGVPRGTLLVDRDGRREALDEVDVRFVHLTEELPGVGRQRLDIAPLALGVDGVEGQRGLPGSGDAGEDDQPVPGEVEVNVAQVVLARAAHHQSFGHGGEPTGRPGALLDPALASSGQLGQVAKLAPQFGDLVP